MSTTSLLELYSLLRRELNLVFVSELKDCPLGNQQALVLFKLRSAPCSMSEISAYTQSDPAASSRTVAALEKAGYVRRKSDEKDARKSIIHLTPLGRELSHYAVAARERVGSALSQSLTTKEEAELRRLLDKVTSGLLENRVQNARPVES